MKLGIDIGSVTAKVVVLDDNESIIDSRYVRTRGQPIETVLVILEELLSKYPPEQFKAAGATGTGGQLIAALLGIPFANEITAQAAGTTRFHPEVRTILEIGGEDSKLIVLKKEPGETAPKVTDFALNGVCAAGTGSFLDQQASRMGIAIEDFGDVALKSENPPRVAGRCSVFAKSDMIHLQQVGTPVHDIVAGLCFAMIRNFKGQVIRGRDLDKPVSFQGGVAANKGIRRAVLEVLELAEKDLIIPEHFAVLGAVGAALVSQDKALPADTLQRLQEYIRTRKYEFTTLSPLVGDNYPVEIDSVKLETDKPVEAYIGVDIGSISTNVVVIDKNNRVLARRYLMTASRPIEAVKQGLLEVGKELGDRVIIKGTGSTGSGRYMTGEFFGADVIHNEITSHARAAAFVCPEVDTIFEIGGQDAKYISLQNGTIVDFAMNKVCAAGTGSFLEEQAEKLGINIKEEFGELGLAAKYPLDLGERCTVFMESQQNYCKQRGAAKEDLVAGLAYSVVKNYLTKVVEDRKIGDHILFQGGTAFNRAVKAAFEAVLGKKITVPPQHDILGAIGVAMLAKDEIEATGRKTAFRGFNLVNRKYELSSFECQSCSNRCEIHKVVFEKEKPLFYGSRCGKWDSAEKKEKRQSSKIPRLFDERAEKLVNTYPKDKPDKPNGKTVGIPRVLFFHELYPLWKGFFTELGFQVVLSDPTNRHIIRQGVENIVEEPCLPIKLAHGHMLNLLAKKPDIIFLPVQCTMEKLDDDFSKSWNCPLTQSLPYLLLSSTRIKEALNPPEGKKPLVLRPVIHPDRGRARLKKVLVKTARNAGITSGETIDKAVAAGFQALDAFNAWQQKRGEEVLSQLKPDEKAIIILGRAYNTYDEAMTLNIPEKLRDMNIMAIPIDFLPLQSVAGEVIKAHPNMYWKAGQKILAAARMIATDPRLFGLYVTNFACGPDSYILKFFGKETEGKPFLTIEIDEHSADAGIITRCEAFIDTIINARTRGTSKYMPFVSISSDHTNHRRVYVPYMIDHGYLLAAAMRHGGVDAEPLPESDNLTLEIGRKYTTGKECYPSIITTGDIVKKTMAPDFDPDHAAFFMPAASGPCRFGQYNRLHRLILDDLNLPNVPILVFDQTGGYHNDLSNMGKGFRINAWRSFIVLDSMQKIVLERRPYEVNKGEIDAVYKEWLDKLIKNVGQDSATLTKFSHQVRQAFEAVKIDTSVRKPRVGIVGEIFVRSNHFANDGLVRKLEALGAQCGVPPIEEWFDYIDHQRKRRYRLHLEGGWRDWTKQKLTEIVMENIVEGIRKEFDPAIESFRRELSAQEIIDRGHKYLTPAVEGEAILSMGRVVEYAEHGFDGIVNILPFGCMPGTIVSLLLHQYRQDYGLPVLNVVVEGTKDPGESIRFEAFIQQAREHLGKKALSQKH
ncbi:MAG: acyl-CoA dehydratase activase [Dehalococcoidales bacterium]|jgi:predicted CoA-substrate-specific enzyme activase